MKETWKERTMGLWGKSGSRRRGKRKVSRGQFQRQLLMLFAYSLEESTWQWSLQGGFNLLPSSNVVVVVAWSVVNPHPPTHLARPYGRFTHVPSPKSVEVNPCNLSRWEQGSWDLPLHKGSQVWHGCLQGIHFLEVRLGTCAESWVKQKVRPTSQHESHESSFMKCSRSNCNDNWPYSRGFSSFKQSGSCLRVGICYYEWDLGLHGNRSLTYLPNISYSTPATQPKARPPLVVDQAMMSRTMPLVW